MKKIAVVVVLFVFLFAISSSADTDTLWACSTDLDCQVLVQNGDSYYCNQQTLTCFQLGLPADPSAPAASSTVTPATTVTVDPAITALEAKISNLENSVAALSSDIGLTKNDILTIQNQITTLQSELANLQNKDQDLSSKTNSLSTGLAGLQQTLDSVQKKLTERQSFSKVITVIFALILIGGAGYGAYYYINRKQGIVNPEIVNYIHNSIKQGKKSHQIKQELRKVGWMDSDIEKAYNETVKQNYRRYKTSQPNQRETVARTEQRYANRASTQRPALNMADPKKMIIIAVISILVITGGLLILRASTGQAIFLKKMIGGEENGTSGEITYGVECTPPHLLNPAGDACCLDSDNSGVCDTTELQGVGLNAGGDCNDNRECKTGLYCVHNKCNSLDTLYSGEGGDCTKLCSYYAIKMLTSDGEKYDLKPKQGSYTGAGALEWKILPIEQHCKGESPIVPINVIKKQTGEIVSEEVILLHEGETSPVLTHPTISKLAFTLTVADVFESCPK